MNLNYPATAAIFGAAMLAAAFAVPARAQDSMLLGADLFGKNSIGGGDAEDASGDFNGELNRKTGRICYYLDLVGIDGTVEAHIHAGDDKANAAGPPLATLAYSPEGDERCVTVSPETAATLAGQPGGYWVDVHTPAFPNGAVRGKLSD